MAHVRAEYHSHYPKSKTKENVINRSSGHRIQKIDIYYSFVGDLETSHVVAQRTLKDRKAA